MPNQTNGALAQGNIGSPQAQQMRSLRKELGTVPALIQKLRPEPRGQNDKILDTTRQGRTMNTLKPQCPPKKGVIVG